MKRIRKSRAARILSWFLTWAMVAPIFGALIAPRSATAQATSPVGNLLTVIVIDFENKTTIGGKGLARFATDAVAVELASSNRFEVLRREEVARQAETLGFRAPYDQAQLARLAQALNANAVVSGEVVYGKVNDKRGEKSVDMGMKVRMMDPSSSELINGAAQVARTFAKPGYSDTDTLAQEALGKSAVASVRQITEFTLPEGIIVNTVGPGTAEGLQILINRGSRDGIKPGQELIVLRGRPAIRVARIKVTNIFPTDSEARVVDLGVGIKPTDAVRAVFPMPDIDTQTGTFRDGGRKSNGNAVSSLGKILLVLAVVAIAATALKNGGSVTGVVAEPDIVNGSPAVQVTWRDNLFSGNTVEYHIWRQPDDPFNFQGTPNAAIQLSRKYTDFAAPYSYWNGTRSFLQPASNNNQGNQGGAGLATAVTPALGEEPGFVVGRSVVYQVTGIVRRTALGAGGGQGQGQGQAELEDIETSPVNSGQATPVNMTLLDLPREPAANINLTAASFSWLSRTGADTYVLELSTDRTFLNKNLLVQFGPVFSSSSTSEGVVMNSGAPLDISTNAVLRRDVVFNNFVNRVPGAPRPTVYWRVGARNNADSPGPVHWFSKNPGDGDRTYRYIYSSGRSFTPADLPPPPP